MVPTPQVQTVSDDEIERIRRFAFWSVFITLVLAGIAIGFILTAEYWLRHISFQAEKRFFNPYADFALKHIAPETDQVIESYLRTIADDMAIDRPKKLVQLKC